MARSKVFDPAQALEAALEVFWNKGYEATSLDDLLQAMQIGRQSMYDTFGDKRKLYLAALAHYVASGGADLKRRLASKASALDAIEEFLLTAANSGACERARGCMAVNAVVEFGQDDPEVARLIEASRASAEEVFAELLAKARDAGELAAGLDVDAAAHFIHTTIRGMRISAKAGASPAQLAQTARLAMSALRARPAT